jgi:hypothetical protein
MGPHLDAVNVMQQSIEDAIGQCGATKVARGRDDSRLFFSARPSDRRVLQVSRGIENAPRLFDRSCARLVIYLEDQHGITHSRVAFAVAGVKGCCYTER